MISEKQKDDLRKNKTKLEDQGKRFKDSVKTEKGTGRKVKVTCWNRLRMAELKVPVPGGLEVDVYELTGNKLKGEYQYLHVRTEKVEQPDKGEKDGK